VSCWSMRQTCTLLSAAKACHKVSQAMKRCQVKPFRGKSMELMIGLGRRIYSLYGLVGCLMWKCSNRPDAVRC
jgi:hypothetical protein